MAQPAVAERFAWGNWAGKVCLLHQIQSSSALDGLRIKCCFLRYWHKLKIKTNSFHNPVREFPPQLPELVTERMVICFHFGLLFFHAQLYF